MRFLVLTSAREAMPPESALPMVQAMKAWVAEHRGSGRMVEAFNFAGGQGGGGILEVESHEELDEIMAGFPLGPFSEIEVHALSDLDAALDSFEKSITQMMQAMG